MNTAVRALYTVPFVGWALRDAVGGRVGGVYLLLTYLVLALVGLVYHYGYAALITITLTATAACLVGLVILTAGDLPGRARRH